MEIHVRVNLFRLDIDSSLEFGSTILRMFLDDQVGLVDDSARLPVRSHQQGRVSRI